MIALIACLVIFLFVIVYEMKRSEKKIIHEIYHVSRESFAVLKGIYGKCIDIQNKQTVASIGEEKKDEMKSEDMPSNPMLQAVYDICVKLQDSALANQPLYATSQSIDEIFEQINQVNTKIENEADYIKQIHKSLQGVVLVGGKDKMGVMANPSNISFDSPAMLKDEHKPKHITLNEAIKTPSKGKKKKQNKGVRNVKINS